MSSLIVEVVRVGKLEKHPDADTLYITKVKGWECIVKEGEISEGDKAIYIPIDSVLPDQLVDQYHLDYLKKGSRVTSVKLRGVFSQGLLIKAPESSQWPLGSNVARELGITKWEPPEDNLDKNVPKGRSNPDFHRYTDIENINNYNEVFEEDELVIITEKIHGRNARFACLPSYRRASKWPWINWYHKLLIKLSDGYDFIVGGHNAMYDAVCKTKFGEERFHVNNAHTRIAKKYDLRNKLPRNCILYGEVYGPKMQDLTYGKIEVDVVFFDLKVDGEYVDYKTFQAFCIINQLPMAPLLFVGRYSEETKDRLTQGKSVICESQIREGIVIRSESEQDVRGLGRKILKSISPAYLLRKNKDQTEYK